MKRAFYIGILVLSVAVAIVVGAEQQQTLARAKRFWSFQPVPQQVELPKGSSNESWIQSPIDRFVLAKLDDKGLKPAPPADRATLLRRATFDLTGLPPTQRELDDFLRDREPDAFTTAVERLLSSPHYGERWARHWMDLVRYAETDGHEFDNDKPNAWRYRDYLIRAFNEDVSYKQFVMEHLAGDLLPSQRLSSDGSFVESPIATAFYWLGENQNSPVDPQDNIVTRVDNQIDVFGKAFNGLTIACARCHDHKFDPIPTSDYYAIAGFFHSMRRGERAIESAAPRNDEVPFAGLRWNLAGNAFAVRDGYLTSGAVSDYRQGIATSSIFKLEHRYLHVRVAGKAQLQVRVDEFPPEPTYSANCECLRWQTYDLRMLPGHPAYVSLIDTMHNGHITLSQVVQSDSETPPLAASDEGDPFWRPPNPVESCPESQVTLAPFDNQPGNTRIHIRGSHKTLGEEAPRRFLTAISGENQEPIPAGSGGRLELARRVTDESNPFLARVMVNRIWQHHFGRGIVATPDNFGLTGEPPTHRELLDWLSRELIASGYSIKHMHRLMVLSSAYQMSSRAGDPKVNEIDPANKYLSHMPVRRMEAEEVRDALLAVAGTLDGSLYGPSVRVYLSPFMDGDKRSRPPQGPLDGDGRRSIYLNIRRNFLPDSLTVWDYPAPISTFGRRNSSLVPSQALFLMNSDLVELQAKRWAERIGDTGASTAKVQRMYVEAFGRQAEATEIEAGVAFLESGHPLADYAHVLFNTAEFVFIR